MDNDIKVSVYCLVYNHGKYLRKCLDGFVNQKTDFKYEVIIHDDCSTDDSQDIIKDYYKKYPELIIPILQTENQYSKNCSVLKKYIYPLLRGKYVAICEGDDYWCDKHKLQRQFNYMEKHPECSLCVHNTIIHDLSGKKKDSKFNSWNTIHELTDREIFFGWNVHTSSYFERKEYIEEPEWALHYWSGDYTKLVLARGYGKVICLPEIMSVYNFGNQYGLTMKNTNASIDLLIKKINARKVFLKEFNEYTHYEFKDIIEKRIEEVDFSCLKARADWHMSGKGNKYECIKSAAAVSSHPYFTDYLTEKKTWFIRFACKFKYTGYKIYPIWNLILTLCKDR